MTDLAADATIEVSQPASQSRQQRNRRRPGKPRGDGARKQREQPGKSEQQRHPPQPEASTSLESPQQSGPQHVQSQRSQQQAASPRGHRARTRRRGLPNRAKQISQIIAKYKGRVISDDASPTTVVYARIKPSDPEFPFDIDTVEVDISVPEDYPNADPWIVVRNSDIPKGYAANVELGWKAIVQMRNKTLAQYIEEFDSQLEELLKRERINTMKVVKFKSKSSAGPSPSPSTSSLSSTPISAVKNESNQPIKFNPESLSFIPKSIVPIPRYVIEEREKQIQCLQQRLGQQASLHLKDPDGSVTYTLNVSGSASSELLPEELKHTFRALLFIPRDLSGCRIRIPDVKSCSIEKVNIETNFNAFAKRHASTWTVIALVNYFVENMEQLMLPQETYQERDAKVKGLAEKEKETEDKGRRTEKQMTNGRAKEPEHGMKNQANECLVEKERDEVKLQDNEYDEGLESPLGEPSGVSEDESVESDSDMASPSSAGSLQHRGTEIRLQVESTNIGVLECDILNIVVTCSRCKTDNEMNNLVSGPYGRESKSECVRCEKCHHILAGSFRKNFIHANNDSMGYVDVANCVIADLLPSTFTVTCARCSRTQDHAFKKLELGHTKNFVCRECHLNMTLKISNFVLNVITTDALAASKFSAAAAAARAKAKNKEQEDKTLRVGGQPLPQNGACQHYKRSFRWFRFSCCNRVYPCDRCHDQTNTHPIERAFRMVCGKCSREQNFSGTCVFCGQEFDNKFTPFWEGGKGTRDKSRMSRKDPHKYKRTKASKPAK